jgi:hypothetical protein
VEAFGAKLAYSSSKQHSSAGGADAQHRSAANGSADGYTGPPATHCNGHAPTAGAGVNGAAGSGAPGQQGAAAQGSRMAGAAGLAALGPAVRYFVMGCRHAAMAASSAQHLCMARTFCKASRY